MADAPELTDVTQLRITRWASKLDRPTSRALDCLLGNDCRLSLVGTDCFSANQSSSCVRSFLACKDTQSAEPRANLHKFDISCSGVIANRGSRKINEIMMTYCVKRIFSQKN